MLPLPMDKGTYMCIAGRKLLTKRLARNRDRLPVVAKLSYQTLRLEREYHIVKRLYRNADAKQLLCQPLEKIMLPNGLVVLIFADYGISSRYKAQEKGKLNVSFQVPID